MHASPLKHLEFELAYLALLTREGLKPLSRWEKPFDSNRAARVSKRPDSLEEALHALGLKTRVVERTVQTGERIRELLFSGTEECLELYASRFEGTPIRRSREDMRIEGLLFGYPSCCVESYAARGYAKNTLRRRDQRILFHWACPHCAVTPLLLPHYHRTFRACCETRGSGSRLLTPRFCETELATQLRRSVALAASVMALGVVPLLGLPALAPDPLDPHVLALPAADDPDQDYLTTAEEGILGMKAVLTGQGDGHWLPVDADQDGDLLTDGEERELGTDPTTADEDQNGVRDGIDLARTVAEAIGGLPAVPAHDQVYRLDFPVKGLERCEVCGAEVNMGHQTVCNPMAQLYVEVPYIALHYLEHDSFSYAGDVHGTGRPDVPLLVQALRSQGPSHMPRVPGDGDADGLRDYEERHFNTDPAKPDSNQDGLPDGYALAQAMEREVQGLLRLGSGEPAPLTHSYAVHHPLRGLVSCSVCGVLVNMGWVDVINPREHCSLELPYLALHFMRHGGFAWSEQDRVNPCLLDVMLHGDGTAHLVPVAGDSDADGLLDGEEIHFGTLPENPDSDGDGVPDGVALARQMHARLARLPDRQQANGIYVTHSAANCFAPCPVCGVELNCGHLIITNVWAELSLTISYRNAHYLEHGSFAASATERIDPVRLETLLRPGVCITCGAQDTTLRWPGQPGRIYQVFTALELTGPWTPGPVFPGEGHEIECQLERGADAPRQFYKVTVQ